VAAGSKATRNQATSQVSEELMWKNRLSTGAAHAEETDAPHAEEPTRHLLKNKHGMAKDRYGHNPEEPARSRRNFIPAIMCDKYY
jgi:hypothetical protein